MSSWVLRCSRVNSIRLLLPSVATIYSDCSFRYFQAHSNRSATDASGGHTRQNTRIIPRRSMIVLQTSFVSMLARSFCHYLFVEFRFAAKQRIFPAEILLILAAAAVRYLPYWIVLHFLKQFVTEAIPILNWFDFHITYFLFLITRGEPFIYEISRCSSPGWDGFRTASAGICWHQQLNRNYFGFLVVDIFTGWCCITNLSHVP